MIESFFRWSRVRALVLATPAGPYLDDLTATLVRQGFGRWALRQRVHGAAHFSRFTPGVSLDALHEDLIPAFRAHLSTCRCPPWLRHGRHADVCAVAGALALLGHLRRIAVVTSLAPAPTLPDLPPLVRRFHTWMQRQRGLQDTTLRSYERVLSVALGTLGDAPGDYTAAAIREVVLRHTKGR
ncbi:MAG: hypothetical protein FJX72_08310, partial [Armatimonadetes bacterium]|nr:hypothetical protein [Armatimonadota bacterium]